MRQPWHIILLLVVSSVMALSAACGGGGDDDDDDSPTPRETTEETSADGPSGEVGVEDLAHAVVQIFALDSFGDPVWTGSGTIISKDGLILTNAHVVDERYDEYDQLGVAITDETDEPPEMEYVGEIEAVDYSLDLAVVSITESIDGGTVLEDFPFVAIGDSDEVGIGDSVRILGYPGIGGETITFTSGNVSGFTSERSVGNRAWIKTDATIAGGNSGGLATNEDGEIVGVPTIAGSGADASSVDCRVIEDTNGDGSLDTSDSCVPVGGFINGLRPVNLALDLIEAAEAGEEYVSPFYNEEEIEATPSGGFDVEGISITSIVFSDGVTEDDQPTNLVSFLPGGTERVCAFWDYAGMEDGMVWDAIWYVDGEQNDTGSIIGDTWVGGPEGSWWVCIFDEDVGQEDGLYEVSISVEGDPIESEAIFVEDGHELVTLDVDNQSSSEICAVWLSPSGAGEWGIEELGSNVTLPSGEIASLQIATGTYDILMVDCSPEPILEEYGVEIVEDSTYTVSDEAS